MRRIVKLVCLVAAMCCMLCSTAFAATSQEGKVIVPLEEGTGSMIIDTAQPYANGYRCVITGTGVRFRSSAAILSTNIIRTFAYNETIWVYQKDISCVYNDGYYWSYVQDRYGRWGYVASKYFALTAGGAQDR